MLAMHRNPFTGLATYEAGGPLFTVSGRRYNEDRKGRELDHHYACQQAEDTISKATPVRFGERVLMTFRFMSGEKKHRLSLQKHGHVMTFFDVFDTNSGRRMGEIRESARHSQKLALRRSSHGRSRPAWDITLMPGIDMALMAALSVIISEWHFKTD
ncbi:hypothetical protein N7532_009894 [Penicillium argentinense]|uniref:Uncharacterized protein n=1 Tax=Penicillium argentinense TaxID=1131581 RepID=A0A9W9JXE6_9EURO|nr:uncharacterized protein N7532_009894 [Penicillium argentinense]KAJ5085123.1 hypothetical protein N7532_009894 [Penicillium argentinense]